jgi:DamX protein
MEPIAPFDALDAVPATRAFVDATGGQPLFIGPALQQRLDLIEHLLEFGRQIIVMSGAAGSGKTAVLDHLSAGQRPNWCLVRLDAQPELGPDALLEVLVEALEIEGGDAVGAALEAHVRARIDALERAGKVVVVVVDDAEDLVPEVVEILVRLAHTETQTAELRLLFAVDPAQASLQDILQQANPQPGLVHMVEIPPLMDEQVRDFIKHRMRVAGFDPDEYFTLNDHERIAAITDGTPANIMALARQTLVEIERMGLVNRPQEARSGGLTRAQVNLAFAALAVLAIVGGAWWANLKPMDAVTTERVELNPLGPPPATPMPPESPAVDVGTLDANPAEMTEMGSVLPPPTGAEGVSSATLPQESDTLGSSLDGASPAPDVSASPTPPLAGGIEPVAGEPVSLPAPSPETAAVPVTEPPPAAPPALSPSAAPVAAASAPPPEEIPAVAPPKPAAPKPTAAKPTTVATSSAAGLLDKPATTHTVQLLGLSDRAKAERFVRERGIAAQASILTTRLNDRPFFLIVYGAYPTRAAAVAAMSQLPAKLNDTQPWARSVGSLRGALK